MFSLLDVLPRYSNPGSSPISSLFHDRPARGEKVNSCSPRSRGIGNAKPIVPHHPRAPQPAASPQRPCTPPQGRRSLCARTSARATAPSACVPHDPSAATYAASNPSSVPTPERELAPVVVASPARPGAQGSSFQRPVGKLALHADAQPAARALGRMVSITERDPRPTSRCPVKMGPTPVTWCQTSPPRYSRVLSSRRVIVVQRWLRATLTWKSCQPRTMRVASGQSSTTVAPGAGAPVLDWISCEIVGDRTAWPPPKTRGIGSPATVVLEQQMVRRNSRQFRACAQSAERVGWWPAWLTGVESCGGAGLTLGPPARGSLRLLSSGLPLEQPPRRAQRGR